uniref:Ig-like domain-containing protein n=1 Tax=Vombatus ursinus TaxID=29139 RepID=A0A4X2LZ00_VOMUR
MKRKLGTSLMILWTQFFWVWGQIKVDQSPQVLNLQEGANAMLECNWSSSVNTLQWFKQNPGEGPVSLFVIASGMKQIGRFSSKMNSKDRHNSLNITDSQRGDSATYFCAIEAQCSPGTCRLCTNPRAQAPITLPARGHTIQFNPTN